MNRISAGIGSHLNIYVFSRNRVFTTLVWPWIIANTKSSLWHHQDDIIREGWSCLVPAQYISSVVSSDFPFNWLPCQPGDPFTSLIWRTTYNCTIYVVFRKIFGVWDAPFSGGGCPHHATPLFVGWPDCMAAETTMKAGKASEATNRLGATVAFVHIIATRQIAKGYETEPGYKEHMWMQPVKVLHEGRCPRETDSV